MVWRSPLISTMLGLVLLGTATVRGAAADTATWTGGQGGWEYTGRWSHSDSAYNDTYPNTSAFDVVINQGRVTDNNPLVINTLNLSGDGWTAALRCGWSAAARSPVARLAAAARSS